VAFDEVVRRAFEDDNSPESANAFLGEALTSWRDCEKSINRTTALLVLACGAAELIIRGSTSELSLAGLKITELGVALYVLPVLVAYLYSSLMALAAESSMNEIAFQTVFLALHPKLADAHLERLLYPANMTFFAGDRLRHGFGTKSRLRKLVDLSFGARPLVLIVLPVLYEIYLLIRLFGRLGLTNVLLWSAAVLSGVLVAAGLVAVVAAALVWQNTDR
jgi:hypothetical protein